MNKYQRSYLHMWSSQIFHVFTELKKSKQPSRHFSTFYVPSGTFFFTLLSHVKNTQNTHILCGVELR